MLGNQKLNINQCYISISSMSLWYAFLSSTICES